jgi:hypothetical protein
MWRYIPGFFKYRAVCDNGMHFSRSYENCSIFFTRILAYRCLPVPFRTVPAYFLCKSKLYLYGFLELGFNVWVPSRWRSSPLKWRAWLALLIFLLFNLDIDSIFLELCCFNRKAQKWSIYRYPFTVFLNLLEACSERWAMSSYRTWKDSLLRLS